MSSRQKECISYIVVDDCGYAPNPWWGVCTLAICKPVIRKTAKEGDLIVGLTPSKLGYGLVYAMEVAEILTLGEYYNDWRYQDKKPDFASNDVRKWMGDNLYEQLGWDHIQHTSAHNIYGREQNVLDERKQKDLSGLNVLIAGLFYYFGEMAPQLPSELDFLQIGRGHRTSGTQGVLAFERYAAYLLKDPGVYGNPRTLMQEAQNLTHLHQQW